MIHRQFADSRHGCYATLVNALSPIVSEFESDEREASYMLWLHGKVAASLTDDRSCVPHDQVMGNMRAIIASKDDADPTC